MNHFGSLIRSLRAERDWSQQQLADRCSLHANTIRKIERTCADPDDLRSATRAALAAGFELGESDLLALYRRPRVPQYSGEPNGGIPIINRAPAGEPVNYEDLELDQGIGADYIPRVGSGVHDHTAFAFVVVGESMALEFQDGDTVVCSPESPISDGDAVFVRFSSERDNTCTFKRIFDRGDGVELVPDNRRHHPLIVPKEQIARMSKAVAKWVRYD